MFSSSTPHVFRIMSGKDGFKSVLVVSYDRVSAVEAFCRLYSLPPNQVAVIYSYPLSAF
jgi:hypothetical protein